MAVWFVSILSIQAHFFLVVTMKLSLSGFHSFRGGLHRRVSAAFVGSVDVVTHRRVAHPLHYLISYFHGLSADR